MLIKLAAFLDKACKPFSGSFKYQLPVAIFNKNEANAFPISPRWLEIVIASIDWNIPLECGDAELELLLKE